MQCERTNIISSPRTGNSLDVDGHDVLVLNPSFKLADEVWTQTEWEILCRHLHNGNGDHDFVMGWRKDGKKHYAKSSTVPVSRAVSWAWRTITEVEKNRRVAFAPYSHSSKALSRWGCLDFDAHDKKYERAKRYAFAAFQFLLNSELTVIFEHTGNGWHVWCIAKDFRESRAWAIFLRGVAKAIEAPIQPGICEIFPDDGKAKAVRAPGSWNPSTDALNAIVWENTASLVRALRFPIGEVTNLSEVHFPNTENNIYGEVIRSCPDWSGRWLRSYAITAKTTRHQKLIGLVGEIFNQVGYSFAAKIIEAQYKQAAVSPRSTLKEHIADFNNMWNGCHKSWLSALTKAELAAYDHLNTENEKDGFKILKSFHRRSIQEGRGDFPIARNNFAMRLGITPKGGAWIRDRLTEAGVIRRTAQYIQYQKAAHYRWLIKETN